MIPEQLSEEVERLRDRGYDVAVIDAEGVYNVLFHGYPLPQSFNKSQTQLLLRLPVSYPNGKPDMFWVDEEITFNDGRIPKQAQRIEHYLGKSWRRFSWHPSCWHPSRDNLETYLEFVNRRLAQTQ